MTAYAAETVMQRLMGRRASRVQAAVASMMTGVMVATLTWRLLRRGDEPSA